MEKLVISYSNGDGYSYFCDTHLPFEFSSKKDAEDYFLNECQRINDNISIKKVFDKKKPSYQDQRAMLIWKENYPKLNFDIRIGNLEVPYGFFQDENGLAMPPEILTLEEWFERNKV